MSAGWIVPENGWSLLWLGSLWRASWQGGLFVLVVWGICRLVPRLPAATRCWLWWLACLKLLLGVAWGASLALPLLPPPAEQPAPWAVWMNATPFASPAASGDTGWDPAINAGRRGVAEGAAAGNTRRAGSQPPSLAGQPTAQSALDAQRSRVAWVARALLCAWLVGVALRLRAWGRQWRVARRLLHEARPLEDGWTREQAVLLAAWLGLRRPPALLTSTASAGPLVAGLPRSVVILPLAAAAQLSPDELRMALAHELAHVQRRDLWWGLVPDLALLLFFFHPLAWLAFRAWVTSREAACDAAALRATGAPPASYGRLLLKLVAAGRSMSARPALEATTSYQSLHGRLEMLRHFALHTGPWMRAGRVLLPALAGISVLPWRVIAAEAAEPRRAALAGVTALQKRLTYSEPKIPLGELVQKVASDTGVPLAAARDVADEPVAVVVQALPARQLLEELADLLDYRWRRKRQEGTLRYEIWQDLAGKQREEALRRAWFADNEKRFRQDLRRYIEMAAQPLEQIRRFRDAEQQRRRVLMEQASLPSHALFRSPSDRGRNRRFEIAEHLSSPIPWTLARLLGRLSRSQWDTLDTGGSLIFTSEPRPGELLLPVETSRTLRASQPMEFPPGQRMFPDDDRAEQLMRQREQEMQEQWTSATGYRVTIQSDIDLKRVVGSSMGPFGLNATATAFRSGVPGEQGALVGGGATTLTVTAGTLDDSLEERGDEDTPQRRAALEKDPILGVKRSFRPKAAPHSISREPGSDTAWPVRDLLRELARTYGVHFLSDAYSWSHPILLRSITNQPTALFTLLDRSAGMTHRWDRRGNLIRLRSRSWFFDRPREFPFHFLRRWREARDRHGAPPLEAYGEMGTALNDSQLLTLQAIVARAELPLDLQEIWPARHALRLYAALSPSQQEALWRGQAIPFVRMMPKQRDLFLTAMRDLARIRSVAARLEDAATGSFSMTQRRLDRVREQRGGDALYRDEEPPAPEGGALPGAGETARPPTRHANSGDGRHFPITRVEFEFHYGPALQEDTPINVAAPSGARPTTNPG